jgi:hypothetical protein
MKKVAFALVLLAFAFQSCRVATCPTYAKKEIKSEVEQPVETKTNC